jgi:hypothetical protein
MKPNWSKIIQNATNVAILVVAVLLAVVLVKNFILTDKRQAGPSPGPPPDTRIPAGTQITIPNIQLPTSRPTLILALTESCRYCTESADFYKRLAQENLKKKSVQLVAVLPQDLERGKKYLDGLGVAVDEIRSLQLNEIGVRATPTLIMLDVNGKVSESWVGKLPKEKEDEVLSRL